MPPDSSAHYRRDMDDSGLESESDVRTNYILTIPSFNDLIRSIDLFLGRLSMGAQYITCSRVEQDVSRRIRAKGHIECRKFLKACSASDGALSR